MKQYEIAMGKPVGDGIEIEIVGLGDSEVEYNGDILFVLVRMAENGWDFKGQVIIGNTYRLIWQREVESV